MARTPLFANWLVRMPLSGTNISATLDSILRACRDNSAAIAATLGECFETSLECRVTDPRPWSLDELPEKLKEAGLAIAIEVEDFAVLCLIPASFPLPDWSRSTDHEAESRRNTLAGELAKQFLPPELIGGRHLGEAVGSLVNEITAGNPTPQSGLIELQFDPVGQAGSPGQSASIYLLYPVLNPPFPETPDWPLEPQHSLPHAHRPPGAAPSATNLQRLKNLPVTISVRLAEKRVPVGQLLSLTPGGIITFNKSCEDLLDLYVNNLRFAQGEAVKIGEKFGLKVNQIGVRDEREPRVQ